MSDVYQPTNFTVPRHIVELEGMTLGYLRVYEAIYQFDSRGKDCWLSTPQIIARSGLEKRHVYNALNYFEKNNILQRVCRKGKRYLTLVRHEVLIGCPPDVDDSANSTEDIQKCTGMHGGVHWSALGGCTGVHTIEDIKYNNNNINKNTLGHSSSAPPKPKTYSSDSRFMKFYSTYPKKKKPKDAWKAFKALKPDDALLDKIVQDVAVRASEDIKWQDKQYIPYPATYLRSAEYDGEITKKTDCTSPQLAKNNTIFEKRDWTTKKTIWSM